MSNRSPRQIVAGSPEPLGASLTADGVNFALWSRNATRVELCLYDPAGVREIARIDLPGRSGDVWHGFVPGLRAGLSYGYRVHGPFAPRQGHRFNPAKLLIDPYARELTGPVRYHETQLGHVAGHPDADLSLDTRDDADFVPKARIDADLPPPDPAPRPATPWRDTVIYELHVKGFTRLSPYLPGAARGTYAGLAGDPAVRYLADLGVTAVELLPIAAFTDEPHLVARGLANYWGYNPVAFMAPEPRLAQADARAELSKAVRALHAAGIEVLLDVVFNHTGEGWHLGPTLSLKGIDNAGYYRLQPDDPSRYVDHAGCGNTLDLSRPHVRRLVLDTLRLWVRDYGVDGFRFDLATTLGREGDAAEFSPAARLLGEIAADPLLAGVKLVAEPWDLGPHGYRVGGFPPGWAEWNDRSRDTIRRFWRGDHGMVGEVATRLAGSADLFAAGRGPLAGVNFVAAHDGMRLRDLVTYAARQNEANGEDNRDGTGENFCVPCGADGASPDGAVRALRLMQMKNMLATLLLSQGVPMLAMGDEVGHSQGGNNNVYCQDGPLSWIGWGALDDEARELLAFTRRMIALRKRFAEFRRDTFLSGAVAAGSSLKDVTWLSPEGEMTTADWQSPAMHCLGMLLAPSPSPGATGSARTATGTEVERDEAEPAALLVLVNAGASAVAFALPPIAGGKVWTVLAATASGEQGAVPRGGSIVSLPAHSLLLLAAVDDEHAALDALCEHAGIALGWHDLSGVEHHPSVATRRALLSALGISVGSPEVEAASLAAAEQARQRRLLAPVVVVRVGTAAEAPQPAAAIEVEVAVAGAVAAETLVWSLRLEDGTERRGEVPLSSLRDIGAGDANAAPASRRLALALPPDLPQGYHRLDIALSGHAASATLIVAPDRCWHPDWLTGGGRAWGVAHQLYSLRPPAGERDWGIGSFSDLARLSDAVARQGGAVVGVNPLNALSLAKPEDGSPYAPSSRRFLNPLYIDVAAAESSLFPQRGDKTAPPPADSAPGAAATIDYAAVAHQKLAALWQLFERFESQERDEAAGEHVAAITAFRAAGGDALERFAIHRVLEEKLGRASLPDWRPYADPASPAVAAFARDNVRRVRFHAWLQYEADRQLGLAAACGLQLGLYGDLAVGIDPHGADVWSEPQAFVRGASFGAPPDPFATEGQDWGLLAFDPLYLKRSAYRPFRDMLAAGMRHAGAIRLDHVMWLERMFFIPHGSKATDGTYVAYPRDDLLAVLALESHRNRCLVVGEDLGTVPLGFREVMAREGILSYKLMAFERYHDGFYLRPDAYPRLALATPGSHDWPTIRGWWSGRDIEVRAGLGLLSATEAAAALDARGRDRELLVAALADQQLLGADFPRHADLGGPDLAELVGAVHGFLARSPAALLMLNLEDLALSAEQVNLPGPLVGYPCWRMRMEHDAEAILGGADAEAQIAAVAKQRAPVGAAAKS